MRMAWVSEWGKQWEGRGREGNRRWVVEMYHNVNTAGTRYVYAMDMMRCWMVRFYAACIATSIPGPSKTKLALFL